MFELARSDFWMWKNRIKKNNNLKKKKIIFWVSIPQVFVFIWRTIYTHFHEIGLSCSNISFYCVQAACDWNDNKATLTLCVVRWAEKLDALTATASQDPEGFLGHPVNAFKLMKRLNTEWGEVEDLVLKDMSDG